MRGKVMREEVEVRRYYTGEVYWTVIIKDGQGDVHVGTYESESEARMVAAEVEEEHSG
jgi:hypothetical protein